MLASKSVNLIRTVLDSNMIILTPQITTVKLSHSIKKQEMVKMDHFALLEKAQILKKLLLRKLIVLKRILCKDLTQLSKFAQVKVAVDIEDSNLKQLQGENAKLGHHKLHKSTLEILKIIQILG